MKCAVLAVHCVDFGVCIVQIYFVTVAYTVFPG